MFLNWLGANLYRIKIIEVALFKNVQFFSHIFPTKI